MEPKATPGPTARGLRELADEGLSLTVRGACMEPHLTEGRRVEVRPARRLWPGDVVAVAVPGRPMVVHRVIGFRPSRSGCRLVTAGDGAPRPDGAVAREHVVGRVVVEVRLRDRLEAVVRFACWALAAPVRRLRR